MLIIRMVLSRNCFSWSGGLESWQFATDAHGFFLIES